MSSIKYLCVLFHKYFFATGHDRAQAENVAAEHPPAKKRRVDESTAAERVSNFHYKGMHAIKWIFLLWVQSVRTLNVLYHRMN